MDITGSPGNWKMAAGLSIKIFFAASLLLQSGCSSYLYHPLVVQYYSYFPESVYQIRTKDKSGEIFLESEKMARLQGLWKGTPSENFEFKLAMAALMQKKISARLSAGEKKIKSPDKLKGQAKASYIKSPWYGFKVGSPSVFKKKKVIRLIRNFAYINNMELKGAQENNSAVALALLGDFVKAKSEFAKCRETNEKEVLASCYNNLGLILELEGKSNEAKDMYASAVKYAPDNEIFIRNYKNMLDVMDRNLSFIKEIQERETKE
jgi:tetratricopeptide (TPR) repeat protein